MNDPKYGVQVDTTQKKRWVCKLRVGYPLNRFKITVKPECKFVDELKIYTSLFKQTKVSNKNITEFKMAASLILSYFLHFYMIKTEVMIFCGF